MNPLRAARAACLLVALLCASLVSAQRAELARGVTQVTAVEGMTVGDPATDDEIGMGPVISAEQQQRVLGFVERAVDAKATVLTGGGSIGDRGFFEVLRRKLRWGQR